ncbi:MAG: hypothetical protein MUF64_19930 [Polyangiaceae bacterium]|nr:hypothetical protein [Polyangiaceae bacterium]
MTNIPQDQVRVLAELHRDGLQAPVLTREVRLRFVEQKTKLLRVRFQLACVNRVCEPGNTCNDGLCVSPEVDPDALPPFSSSEEALDPAGCFDPATCFPSPLTPIPLPAPKDPPQVGPQLAFPIQDPTNPNLNVAAVWSHAPDQLAPLSKDTGWTLSGNTLILAPWVNEAIALGTITRLFLSYQQGCPSKLPSTPVCASGSGAQGGYGGSGQGGEGGAGAGGEAGAGGSFPEVVGPGVVGATGNACAWSEAGEVWCWGRDTILLGSVPGGYSSKPRKLELIKARKVVLDYEGHGCALGFDDRVQCWGGFGESALCNGKDCQTAPVQIPGTGGAVDLVGTSFSACILNKMGEVWCWGNNRDGAVGNGTDTPVTTPVKVTLEGNAKRLFGRTSVCAVLEDGSTWCWGAIQTRLKPWRLPLDKPGSPGEPEEPVMIASSYFGRLHVVMPGNRLLQLERVEGDEEKSWQTAKEIPVPLTIRRLDAWVDDMIALDDQGQVWTARTSLSNFTKREGLKGVPALVTAGQDSFYNKFFCVRTQDGAHQCWGGNRDGELGNERLDLRTTPTQIMTNETFDQLVHGNRGLALRTNTGAVHFCGRGPYGPGEASVPTPSTVDGLKEGISQLYPADPGRPYVRLVDGSLRVLEHDDQGTMLTTNPMTEQTPDIVTTLGTSNTTLYDLALKGGKLRVLSLGETSNMQGELAQNNTIAPGKEEQFFDATVLEQKSFSMLSTGQELDGTYRTHCVASSQEVLCWGDNSSGQTGNPASDFQLEPIAPPLSLSAGETIVQLASTSRSHCLRTSQDKVWCWGDNSMNQLCTIEQGPTPRPCPMVAGTEGLGCGSDHCCAWKGAEMWCWGDNRYGQLGAGDLAPHLDPVKLPLFPAPVAHASLQGRGQASCVVLTDQSLWCWGSGYEGENCAGLLGKDTPVQDVVLSP